LLIKGLNLLVKNVNVLSNFLEIFFSVVFVFKVEDLTVVADIVLRLQSAYYLNFIKIHKLKSY
jgi:hypothetical protein